MTLCKYESDVGGFINDLNEKYIRESNSKDEIIMQLKSNE